MKRFISGFLLGALIFALPVFAQNSSVLEVFYNNIKLKVYGQTINTEGNEPFIVNGRTYVPARYVAEAMGGVVKWNETENVVEITQATPQPTATPEPVKMTSDGLEAEYRYDFNGYYVPLNNVTKKYNLTSKYYEPDISITLVGKTKTVKLAIRTNNTSYISLKDYETVFLPAMLIN